MTSSSKHPEFVDDSLRDLPTHVRGCKIHTVTIHAPSDNGRDDVLQEARHNLQLAAEQFVTIGRPTIMVDKCSMLFAPGTDTSDGLPKLWTAGVTTEGGDATIVSDHESAAFQDAVKFLKRAGECACAWAGYGSRGNVRVTCRDGLRPWVAEVRMYENDRWNEVVVTSTHPVTRHHDEEDEGDDKPSVVAPTALKRSPEREVDDTEPPLKRLKVTSSADM